ESDVVVLTTGDHAVVTIDAVGLDLDATIERIIPAADPQSRTFVIELVAANSDQRLKSGMFARARTSRGQRTVLTVPSSAVVSRGALEGTFVLDDNGVARLRWVRTGRVRSGRVEVLSGIDPGERVVVAPSPGFVDGTRVEMR
ncbi:MAG: efflux RND transporter periplasmic adaptor subunit, partial [Acidobacteriota bacterium]